MLCGAPPRGMPGARIEQVKLQQANDGHPLDDVILTLTDAAGQAAWLEIQAKRSVSFAPADKPGHAAKLSESHCVAPPA